MPLALQDRVLTWGIIGAVAMRGVMIGAGVAAVHRFRWMTLLFAAILLVSAIKLLMEDDEGPDDQVPRPRHTHARAAPQPRRSSRPKPDRAPRASTDRAPRASKTSPHVRARD